MNSEPEKKKSSNPFFTLGAFGISLSLEGGVKIKYPANTPEMKKFSQWHVYRKKNDYASSSITVVEFFQNTYTSSKPPSPPHPFAKL